MARHKKVKWTRMYGNSNNTDGVEPSDFKKYLESETESPAKAIGYLQQMLVAMGCDPDAQVP
jgi:hypothetical protein